MRRTTRNRSLRVFVPLLVVAGLLLSGCDASPSDDGVLPNGLSDQPVEQIIAERFPGSAEQSAVAFVEEPAPDQEPIYADVQDHRIVPALARRLRGDGVDLTQYFIEVMRDPERSARARRRAVFLLASLDTPAGRAALLAAVPKHRSLSGRNLLFSRALLDAVARMPLWDAELDRLLACDDDELSIALLTSGNARASRPPIAARMSELLAADESALRAAAVRLLRLAAASSGSPDPRLLTYLERAEYLPGENVDLELAGMTVGEHCIHLTTSELARTERGPEILRRWSSDSSSDLVRDYCVVALAEVAEDATQLEAVRRVLTGSDRSNLRSAAARSLGEIGDEADIPALESAAAGDPATAHGCVGGASYPVRDTATAALERIRSRARGSGER